MNQNRNQNQTTPGARPPLVSIITPAYNAAAFIGETIASVRAQTFDRWEMIVADDGSTDGTADAARAAAQGDPRITVFTLETPGRRPAVPRNAALARARGRVIAFLDADDLWEPDKLRTQLARLARTGAGWGFANSRFFGGGEAHPEGLKYPRRWRPPRPFFPHLVAGEGVPCLTLVVRRELLERVSPAGDSARAFDEDPALRAVEDWDLTLRLARVAEPDYWPRPLARYRTHAAGISKRGEANFRARLAVIDKCRRDGADERLLRRAEDLQRSKFAVDRLFERAGALWRGELLRAVLRPPFSARNATLAAIALLPAPLARIAYRAALSAKRRR